MFHRGVLGGVGCGFFLALALAVAGEAAKHNRQPPLKDLPKESGQREQDEKRLLSLKTQARQFEQKEVFAAALNVRQQALALATKLYGAESWQVTDARLESEHTQAMTKLAAQVRAELREADKLMIQAVANNQPTKYQAGAEQAEKATAIRMRALGEVNRLVASSAGWAGLLWHSGGNTKKALPYYEQALAIDKKVLGDNHPGTATSLNNLGMLLSNQGDYGAARPYVEQALAIRKKVLGDNHPATATSLNNLGMLLSDQGDYAAARPYLEQALAIDKKVRGDNHPDTATSLNNLGMLLSDQGDYAAARPYLEQALAMMKQVLGDNHPMTARPLSNLGMLLSNQGDYAAARPYLEQALAIDKKFLGDNHPGTARSLNNLGFLFLRQGDHAAARPYFEQALVIRKKLHGDYHPDTARSLDDLGFLLSRQGDYAAARLYVEQALAVRKKVLGDNHPDTAESFDTLGGVLSSQGHYAAARLNYEQALVIRKKLHGDYHPNTAVSLYNFGILLYTQGDYTAARSYLEQALVMQHRLLDVAAVALAERQQLAMSVEARQWLDSFLSLPDQAGVTTREFYASTLAWKGSVSLRQRQIRLLRQEPALADLANELLTLTARLAQSAVAVGDPKDAADRRRLQIELTEKKENLEVELARRSEAFKKGQELYQVKPEQVQAALPTDVALVDFLEYWDHEPDPKKNGQFFWQRKLTAFLVRKDQPIVRLELGPAAAIQAAVDAWRQGAVARASLQGKDQRGQELRRLLWLPLENHLAGATTVLIAPDGAVAGVPFGALPGKQQGKFLLEEITLGVVPLPRLIPALLEEQPKAAAGSETLLLAGDINYGAPAGKSDLLADSRSAARSSKGRLTFGALEGTGPEIQAVRASFEKRFPLGKATELRKDEPTEAAFRKLAPGSRWLHLATHGFFAQPAVKAPQLPTNDNHLDLFGGKDVVGFHPGLLSGLALAGANREPVLGEDDGILTALEVAELDLRRTELVVLSACETGLGKVAGGEGILGLQRSFQLAGASTTVTSLWHVDDKATQFLMEKFYENLWKHQMPKAQALRQAQLTMLREGTKRGVARGVERIDEGGALPTVAPPYYWAAFVLSGDWR